MTKDKMMEMPTVDLDQYAQNLWTTARQMEDDGHDEWADMLREEMVQAQIILREREDV